MGKIGLSSSNSMELNHFEIKKKAGHYVQLIFRKYEITC